MKSSSGVRAAGVAHQLGLRRATKKSKPDVIPVSKIAATGYPLEQYADVVKVQRMQNQLRSGKKLPPVRVTELTPELRDKYGVTDPSKKFYLNNGHHRLAAAMLEGKKQVRAVSYHEGKRL